MMISELMAEVERLRKENERLDESLRFTRDLLNKSNAELDKALVEIVRLKTA